MKRIITLAVVGLLLARAAAAGLRPAAGGPDAAIDGLLPRPERPAITAIEPPQGFRLGEGVPQVPLADDRMPTAWLYACPFQGKWDEAQAAFDAGGEALLETLKPLPPDNILKESYPDFTPAIDLLAVSDQRQRVASVYYTVLENDRPRVLRVCVGAVGDGAAARMWLAGHPVAHGSLVRLQKGPYPMLVAAYVGTRRRGWQWAGAHLAPRLTEVAEEEVEAVHQWRLAEWQTTLDAARADDDKLLAAVRFDPETVRGTEGFFRVGRSVGGRWWFIDPQGKAFYYRGICALNRGGIGGRRLGKPPVEEDIVAEWLGLLRGWGFNATGSWTTPEFFDRDVPFTEIIEGFYSRKGTYEGAYYLEPRFPDVFDPAWAEEMDAKCRDLCTPLKDSRLLVGYFLDNERGFMETLRHGVTIVSRSPTYRARGRGGAGLLQFCLGLDGARPACRRAWEFVLGRHGGDAAKVGRAWGVPIASRESVGELTARGEVLVSEGYLEDETAFVRLWVGQYYRTMTEAIRRYDPNHLTLGVRWGAPPGPAVLEEEGRWADVVSQNNYRAEMYDRLDIVHRATGRPVLNGELACGTDSFLYVRNPIEPPGGYEDAAVRQALRERDALDRAFSHPGIVGYTYYKWYGRPPDLGVVRPLQRANYRAVSIAAGWDRPPARAAAPLDGQYFVCLQSGAVGVTELAPPDPQAEPSLRISTGELYLGLACRKGTWDKRVWGNGITGEVTDASADGGRVRLALKIRMVPGLFTETRGTGQYVVELERDDTRLEGTFRGTFNGRDTSGRVTGYEHRPVPTVRY